MTLKRRGSYKTPQEVVLANTGYANLSELEGKEFYRIDNLDNAAEMIIDAIRLGIKITIIGDYDVDGTSSTSILYYTIKKIGGNVSYRIPKRISEGFGLNMNIIDEIDEGLIITVDNGIVAFDPVKAAKEKGLKVIITDHHLPDESGRLPEADIIIDPHIPGTADFEDYCGAGIAFRLAQLLTDDQDIIAKISCFAALGTVADVMPLIEENRQIVKLGLKNMTSYNTKTSGLYSILLAADKDKHITAHDIAFKIGPMLNSWGRLFDTGANKVVDALVFDGFFNTTFYKVIDFTQKELDQIRQMLKDVKVEPEKIEELTKASYFADSIGVAFNQINEIRKKIVEAAMRETQNNIALNNLHGDIPLVVYEPIIPEGVVGIISGHLAEDKQRPTFIFTDSLEAGIYKGSGRTAGGVHLKNLLDAVKETTFKYGGHEGAAGVSVEASKFEAFKKALQENCPVLQDTKDDDVVEYDLEIEANQIASFFEECKKLEPFGEGNPFPVFLVKNFQLSPRYSDKFRTMGSEGQHLKLFGIGCSAVAFSMIERFEELSQPDKLDLVGTLSENFYKDKGEVQIEVEYMDVAQVGFSKTLLALALEKKAKERY